MHRDFFVDNCADGDDKRRELCSCMQNKVEIKYPYIDEMQKVAGTETLNLFMKQSADECVSKK